MLFVLATVLGAGLWRVLRAAAWPPRAWRMGSAAIVALVLVPGVAFARSLSISDAYCAGLCTLYDIGLVTWWWCFFAGCWC